MYIDVEIEKVLELKGPWYEFENNDSVVSAYVFSHLEGKDINGQHVLLGLYLREDQIRLGEIDPETKEFKFYDPSSYVTYNEADNDVICKLSEVPEEQVDKSKKLEDILNIPGISVTQELTPE